MQDLDEQLAKLGGIARALGGGHRALECGARIRSRGGRGETAGELELGLDPRLARPGGVECRELEPCRLGRTSRELESCPFDLHPLAGAKCFGEACPRLVERRGRFGEPAGEAQKRRQVQVSEALPPRDIEPSRICKAPA